MFKKQTIAWEAHPGHMFLQLRLLKYTLFVNFWTQGLNNHGRLVRVKHDA